MRKILKAALIAAALTGIGVAGAVGDENPNVVVYQSADAFDDATFALENAIIEAGLKVDHVSHVGEMLERTRGDVGSDVIVFGQADVYQFCSAVLSRKVMEIDPLNIAHCPYGVFVAQAPGEDGAVLVGYRKLPEGEMQEVQALLDGLAREAAGVE
ncbi:MAG: DUF302 domain-containing protein [Neomegalonema sp.]|nr:DUF302 domain-containing protein [Neomegalonema sp.]